MNSIALVIALVTGYSHCPPKMVTTGTQTDAVVAHLDPAQPAQNTTDHDKSQDAAKVEQARKGIIELIASVLGFALLGYMYYAMAQKNSLTGLSPYPHFPTY